MKCLRFLTGAHAGAHIPLAFGVHRIGASDACDICVSDWQGDELCLEVDEQQGVHIRQCDGDEGAVSHMSVPDFVASSFGTTVLCVGPDDTAWPSDIELLAGVLAGATPPKSKDVRRLDSGKRGPLQFTGVALAGTMVASALIAGIIMFGTQASHAVSPARSSDAIADELSATLHGMGLRELTATASGNSVIVRGMVPSATEDVAARRVIAQVGDGQVDREYDVAQDDVRSIQESLSMTGTHVAYLGDGAFRISGTVASLASFRLALANVRTDLDANVKKIEPAVNENPVPIPTTDYSEMVAIGDLRYIETPDGVKHIYPAARHDIN